MIEKPKEPVFDRRYYPPNSPEHLRRLRLVEKYKQDLEAYNKQMSGGSLRTQRLTEQGRYEFGYLK